MPTSSTVPPAGRQARERERNRAKQQAYRDRQKKIRLEQALNQTTQDDGPVVVETASLTGPGSKTTRPVKRPKATPARPSSVKPAGAQSSSTISRMAAKLAELGVDQLEIDRLVSEQEDDQELHGELVVRHQCLPSNPPSLVPRRPSTFELTPATLFAGVRPRPNYSTLHLLSLTQV